MRRIPIIVKLILSVVALVAVTAIPIAYTSHAETPGSAAVVSCQDGACHADIGGERYAHKPVAAGACTVCHIGQGGSGHEFELAAQDADLCYQCHVSVQTEKVVHQPVLDGLCTGCHDPHSSPNRNLLVASPPSEICFTCHVNDKTVERVVHGPLAVGDCTACHDPHESPYEARLRKQGNDLCFSCHLEMLQRFESAKHSHPPAKENCVNCHDPHNSPYDYRLYADVPDLCFTCHQDKQEEIANAITPHDATRIDKKCLNCHDPHTSDIGKQLKDNTLTLCLKCHNQEQMTPTGPVENIARWLEQNPDHHGPIRQQDCAGCHNPHGSDNFRILKKYFPPKFYAAFDLKNYELCFSCHLSDLVLVDHTSTLTGFRNGDRNLHYVHVNRMEKGRTCRACHQIHATVKPKHIRESVPFGGWDLPINYEKNDQGGRCSPGCHVSRGYDREDAIDNP